MVANPVARALECPTHGVLVARIVDHPLWEAEVVEVLHPSPAGKARYVVRFASHKRRTVWFGHLRILAMRPPSWWQGRGSPEGTTSRTLNSLRAQ
jgi:hypothetical protein